MSRPIPPPGESHTYPQAMAPASFLAPSALSYTLQQPQRPMAAQGQSTTMGGEDHKRKREAEPAGSGGASAAASGSGGGGQATGSGSGQDKATSSSQTNADGAKKPRGLGASGRKGKSKACVYCRRSHMVCDTLRPCSRCIKRGIDHLCTDQPPPSGSRSKRSTNASRSSRQTNTSTSPEREVDPDPNGGFEPHELDRIGEREESPVAQVNIRSGKSAFTPGGGMVGISMANGVPRRIGGLNVARGMQTFARPSSFGSSGMDSGANPSPLDLQGLRFPSTSSYSSANLTPGQGPQPILASPQEMPASLGGAGPSASSNIYGQGSSTLPAGAHPAWPLLPSGGSHGDQQVSEPGMNWSNWVAGPQSSGGAQQQDRSYSALASDSGAAQTAGPSAEREADPSLIGGPAAYAYDTPGNSTFPMAGSYGVGLDGLSQGEFAPLSGFLESLGIPSLPGGLGDIFGMGAMRDPDPGQSSSLNTEIGGDSTTASSTWDPPTGGMGSTNTMSMSPYTREAGKGDDASPKDLWEKRGERAAQPRGGANPEQALMSKVSKTERYLLAAADQASGTRDERLAQVIRAKYEAGLLKPYDYSRGYARMIKWMEKNVTPSTKQAILRPLSAFRPAFRAIAQTLSDIDLVFVEEAFERLMLDYDRVFSAIHTPACLWRRTGEIYKANREFATLTGIPAAFLRAGKIGIYQLMTEESTVKYYENLASIAFDAAHRSVNTVCTLRIPVSLTRLPTTTTPHMNPANPPMSMGPTPVGSPTLPPAEATGRGRSTRSPDVAAGLQPSFGAQSLQMTPAVFNGSVTPAVIPAEEFRTIKCCFSFTIRRDSWGIPIALIGNWIPLS